MPRHFEIVKNIHNPNLTVFVPQRAHGPQSLSARAEGMNSYDGLKAIRLLRN